MKRTLLMLILAALAFVAAYGVTKVWNGAPATPPGMVWVPGGEFTMGSDAPDAARAEGPLTASASTASGSTKRTSPTSSSAPSSRPPATSPPPSARRRRTRS